MIGHLGTRVTALLDGQLSHQEEERAWAHVHGCRLCADRVEREGWVKRQLATLAFGSQAPDWLKGALVSSPETLPEPWSVGALGGFGIGRPARRTRGFAALSGGALGVTVFGLLALGAAPAAAPVTERRAPVVTMARPAEALRSNREWLQDRATAGSSSQIMVRTTSARR